MDGSEKVSPNDRNHKRAAEFFESKAVSGARFVIGHLVLVEFLNGASKRAGKGQRSNSRG